MNDREFYISGVIGSTVARAVDRLEITLNGEINVEIVCPGKSQICGDHFMISDGKVTKGTSYYAQYKDYIITDFKSGYDFLNKPWLILYVRNPQQHFYIDEFAAIKPASIDFTESTYDRGDLVIYNNDLYKCTTAYDSCYSEARKFKVKRVIVNGPATIVFWEDGTKTVAKCLPEDKFDFEKGIAICFMKKATRESCVKIFEKAREDNLKKLQDDLTKLNKELERKRCSEDATSTS